MKPAEEMKIVKVGGPSPTPPPPPTSKTGGRKSMRTFPRGVLKKTQKIRPVRDPAKAPPRRRSGTLRILTDAGVERRRRRIETTVRNLPDQKVKETLEKSGFKVKNPKIAREILKGGMEAGFISSP